MAKPTQHTVLILEFLITLLISAGCWSLELIEPPLLIREVSSPQELSEDLRNMEFFLYKTGDFGSKVVIQNLAMTTLYNYENDHFITGVDVSPDGKYMIYNQVYRYDDVRADYIWRLNLETGGVLKIAGWKKDIMDLVVDAPSISADGKTVLFSMTDLNTGKDGLARVGMDGKDLQILETTKRLVFAPEASPDGSLILVLCSGYGKEFNHTGLCLLKEDGEFIKYVADEDDFYGNYDFSPDGMKIVFCQFDSDGILGVFIPPHYRYYIYDIQSGERKLLLSWNIGLLGFSPDGQRILFIANPKPKSPINMYLINLDGTNLMHLAYFDDFLAEWYKDAD